MCVRAVRTTLGALLLSLVALLACAPRATAPVDPRPQPSASRPVPASSSSAGSPAPRPSVTVAACEPSRCGFDPSAERCRAGIAQGATDGPRCACDLDGACVLKGYVGPLPCSVDDDCCCGVGYVPAPPRWFPRRPPARPTDASGVRPGDCIASCRDGACRVAQGPM
jgi:hypothetical protein